MGPLTLLFPSLQNNFFSLYDITFYKYRISHIKTKIHLKKKNLDQRQGGWPFPPYHLYFMTAVAFFFQMQDVLSQKPQVI